MELAKEMSTMGMRGNDWVRMVHNAHWNYELYRISK